MRPQAKSKAPRRVRGVLALICAGAALAGVGKAVADDAGGIPSSIAHEFNDFMTGCDPMSDAQVKAMSDKLQADHTTLKANDPAADSVETRRARAAKHGQHIPDVSPYMNEIQRESDAHKIIDTINKLTSTEYGFTTTAENYDNPDQIRRDAVRLTYKLSSVTTEVGRAASTKHLVLESTDPPRHSSDGGGRYDGASQTIYLTPGAIGSFGHEMLGHGMAYSSSLKHCAVPTISNDPNFSSANPATFTYGKRAAGDTSWQGITFSDYGASENAEDVGEAAEQLSRTADDKQLMKCPFGDGSSVTRLKTAITLARWDELAPGAGAFYSETLATEANSYC